MKSAEGVNTDDAAEAAPHVDHRDREGSARKQKKKQGKSGGQNTNRSFGSSRDALALCGSRTNQPELSPEPCPYGVNCRKEHDLRKYLREGKRADLTTFDGVCPVWAAKGKCHMGWKCRFLRSHMETKERENGVMELVLTEDVSKQREAAEDRAAEEGVGTVNIVNSLQKNALMKKRMDLPKSDLFTTWLNAQAEEIEEHSQPKISEEEVRADNRARYTEPPLMPSEKRRLYFGPETPVLAPLTTQGNLPFRRLCVELGAQITYSEMAMSLPLIMGQKSEWALMKAHESELGPPTFSSRGSVVADYDHSRDLKFGAQIAAQKPWLAMKATEAVTTLCPHIRVVDLNCGCPIDLVYRTGAGSALLDSHGKLEKIVRGMNFVSGEVPISIKIRMGTKTDRPTALKLIQRLVYGNQTNDSFEGGPGVAAITLHGRSRQQRYTRVADWTYISECAALIKKYNTTADTLVDTVAETDPRTLAAAKDGKVYFLGNGDCYSHLDYQQHLDEAKVDSVMVARGALIKPWLFEEIQQGQYLDKSPSERLEYVEKFVKYGLECWGSDEMGVGTTRRFLLEWLSFAHRYVPVGILEHLPPHINDRPPAWKGRSEMETLLGSDNYKDWIKIRLVRTRPCVIFEQLADSSIVRCTSDPRTRTFALSRSIRAIATRLRRRKVNAERRF